METVDAISRLEAWAAMVSGKCIETRFYLQRITTDNNGVSVLQWYSEDRWENTSQFYPGPYYIVPDPSKLKVSQYEKDKDELINPYRAPAMNYVDEFAAMIYFVEKYFQRKEV